MHEQSFSRSLARGCLLLAVAIPSGCAAIKATQQPPKRNLGVLAPGVPRTHVIAELGAPTWSEQREGETIDVFTFKQGYAKTTKAARALAHGAADVATFGLWEVVGIPMETIADGTDVQLEVHYGPDHHVASVHVIKGDGVVNPKPNVFARAFRRKSPANKATAVASSTASEPSPSSAHIPEHLPPAVSTANSSATVR